MLELIRRPVDIDAFLKKTALESDTEKEIEEYGTFCVDGVPVIHYSHCDFDLEYIRKKCRDIKYHGGERASGLACGDTRCFGALPRDPLRKDWTGHSSLHFDYPDFAKNLYQLGSYFSGKYFEFRPDIYEKNLAKSRSILPFWRMGDTPFTSGIINSSNPLKYHFDRGNFKESLSCMLTLRKNMSGGYLSMPEFGVRFKLRDSSYLLFDGQSILHGVTPMQNLSDASYRYTIVYYSLEALLKSKSPEEEFKELKKRAVNKYSRRAGLIEK